MIQVPRDDRSLIGQWWWTVDRWALGAVLAAFATEIFWAAIQAVPQGQWDAARSLGMGFLRILFLVILPQAIRIAVPLLTNRAIAITKGTALGTAVALVDLLIKDTSGDTGLPPLLGWAGMLPCLAGLLAVTLLWSPAGPDNEESPVEGTS